MKKSIKILISLLLICTIMLPFGVRAVVDTGSSIHGSDPGGGDSTSGGSSNKVYMVKELKGVRVTFVDKDGKRINNKPSVEFVNNFYSSGGDIYSTTNKYSRNEIVNGGTVSFKKIGCSTEDKNNKNHSCGKDMSDHGYKTSDSYGIVSSLNTSNYAYTGVASTFTNIANNANNLTNFLKDYFGTTYNSSDSIDWYLMVEPLITVSKSSRLGYVIGTPTELSKYANANSNKMPGGLANYYADFHVNYNYLYFDDNTFNGKNNGITSTFNALSIVNIKVDSNPSIQTMATAKKGFNVGLIWLGMNATPPSTPCSNYKDRNKDIWTDGWTYNSDAANNTVDNNAEPGTIRSTCGLAPKPCSNYEKSKTLWTGGWKYDSNKANNNVASGSSDSTIRSTCGIAPIPCSDYKDKNTTIWIDGWVYDSNKASTKIAADAANNTDTIRKTCGYQITCENDDIYNKSTDFTDVQLTSNTSRNCCKVLEGNYANDKNKLNELYRDHNECYECKYDPTKIKPTCSTGDNKKTTGYTFTRDVGNATVTADTYTCISWAVDGKDKNVSKNLFTKKEINKYCKVICSETVTLEFPFFNNGNSVRYVTKNSIFAWPKKNNSDEDELKLKASGKLTCWYRVNLVGLYNEFGSDKNGAVELFNQCKDDMNKSLTTPENILPGANSYNLSGSFKVKTDDDPNYVSLAKENGTNSVSYTKQTSSAEITLSATKGNVSSLVRAAEKLKFEVTENANFVISNTGKDAGYSYSYDGKYYRSKTDVGISNIKSNNIIKFEPSLKFNEKTGSGNVSIIYSNIGGSSPKFIENEQTYENKDESGLKNHRCVYKKINNGKEYLCPSETKNEGMNLSIIMTNESLSYEEAVKKYCNSDSDSGMTVCPSNSYYSGKPISKSCYDNENCQKLTCYIHECTDSGGTCHILNSCMTRQIEDYGKTLDEAKKICTNKYCDGKPGNIEYRVIDLKDPFPGIEAKSGFSSFNSNIKGRKPGSNWNSIKNVQKEILNNRGVKGDEVYNLTPLYEFNLTPSVIKAIREYNDNHSYDDFTLSCKGNNKQACVASGFDFKTKFGIVKVIEQCKGISNLGKFNSCYNNDSLR